MSKPALTPLQPIPGWFGKIPNLGDFASRRLPDAFIRRWDAWLTDGLAQVRGDLGERWREFYRVAPIVRFWIGRGTLGRSGWVGLIMPSVDRVGRYFPLTFARPLDSLAAALAARAWYAALDAAARRALDVNFTAADLDAALQALPPLDAEVLDTAEAREARALATRLLGTCVAGESCSIWWRDDAHADAAFTCFAGLPPATAFTPIVES